MPVSLMADELLRVVTLTWPDGSIRLSNDEWGRETEHWFADLVGWFGGVGSETEQSQRALTHGIATGETRRTGRTLTLSGELFFPQQDLREAASRYVSGILGDGRRGNLAVVTEGNPQFIDVQLDGEIKWAADGSEWITIEIPLMAPDPWIYGPRKTSQLIIPGVGEGLKWGSGLFEAGHLRWGGGRRSSPRLSNEGNAAAWPVFTVRGNFPEGFSIITGGRSVEWAGAVTTHAPAVVDFGAGTVTVGDRDLSHMLVWRQWTPIPPGGSITPQFRPRSSFSEGWADAAWQDTYI